MKQVLLSPVAQQTNLKTQMADSSNGHLASPVLNLCSYFGRAIHSLLFEMRSHTGVVINKYITGRYYYIFKPARPFGCKTANVSGRQLLHMWIISYFLDLRSIMRLFCWLDMLYMVIGECKHWSLP